ncbi:hypothetical protein Gotri_016439 [Gossypium trilobum]|uniref:BHLH domain-containing protein n=1 Tax=Gossypium trilobum TaxID=34281 RepID=A0A7J9E402_9ROSI|nr:hypothetical protein [Gossypium trilobum]
MCALAPFPTPNWPLLNPIGHQLNYIYENNETLDSVPQASFDPCVVKKLNHNASERHRRKTVNSLFSSLRSLLPLADQMKKVSIPATVSEAVKYIPELQEQVERLVHKKEELLLRISQQGGIKRCSDGRCSSSATVSINRLTSDSEVVIQITLRKDRVQKTQLSEILHILEEQQGLILLNATSFESFGGMIFYTIHLQVAPRTTYQLRESDIEALRGKLLALCN